MTTTKPSNNLSESQAALCRAALALDSFLINGIPMGIIHQTASEDFLPSLADKYYSALNDLARLVPQAPKTSQPTINSLLTQARETFDQMQQATTSLVSFRNLSSQEIQSAVSDIAEVRQDGIRILQELEQYFDIPESFYQTRSTSSQENVERFMANLIHLLDAERKKEET